MRNGHLCKAISGQPPGTGCCAKHPHDEENMTPEQKLDYYCAQFQQNPQNPDIAYKYAYELHKAGKIKDSIYYYNQVITLDSKNTDAYINLAQAYKQTKEYDKAASTLDKAKILFPENKIIKNLS